MKDSRLRRVEKGFQDVCRSCCYCRAGKQQQTVMAADCVSGAVLGTSWPGERREVLAATLTSPTPHHKFLPVPPTTLHPENWEVTSVSSLS